MLHYEIERQLLFPARMNKVYVNIALFQHQTCLVQLYHAVSSEETVPSDTSCVCSEETVPSDTSCVYSEETVPPDTSCVYSEETVPPDTSCIYSEETVPPDTSYLFGPLFFVFLK